MIDQRVSIFISSLLVFQLNSDDFAKVHLIFKIF